MDLLRAKKACSDLLEVILSCNTDGAKEITTEAKTLLTNNLGALNECLDFPVAGVSFRTSDGQEHSYSLDAAAQTLQEYLDEWPGGLSEIESALKTAQKKGGTD